MIVFLLIGFEVSLRALLAAWPAIVLAYLTVMLSRAAIVGGTSALFARTSERLPRGWAAVLLLTWRPAREPAASMAWC